MNESTDLVSKYWLDEEGMLRIQLQSKEHVHITLRDARYHVMKCMKLCEGSPRPMIIDVRRVFGSISREASQHIISSPELNKLRMAEGFIVRNLATLLTVKFTFSNGRTPYPCSAFVREDSGVMWLKKYQNS